jgi:hypothetical protein
MIGRWECGYTKFLDLFCCVLCTCSAWYGMLLGRFFLALQFVCLSATRCTYPVFTCRPTIHTHTHPSLCQTVPNPSFCRHTCSFNSVHLVRSSSLPISVADIPHTQPPHSVLKTEGKSHGDTQQHQPLLEIPQRLQIRADELSRRATQ